MTPRSLLACLLRIAGRCRLLGVFLSCGTAFAQGDQAIYADALGGGWQNWSWATVNLAATAPVHSGIRSASVTAGAWEAIYLHHDAFDSTGYTDLVVWLHGGSGGGQRLQVQGLLTGTAQAAFTLPPLAANTWQQFVIPLSTLGVANRPNLDGFWIQDVSGSTQPTWYLDDMALRAVAAPTTVNIAVDASQVVRTLDARHFGVNAAIWDAQFNTPTTISLLQEMGNATLRFPGGSISDEYHWQSNTTGNNTWQWATSFDDFVQVASATATEVFITVNYGTGTPAEAADWVRNANVTRGLGFKYWEIGNENYGTWETDANPRPHDPYTYALRFRDYALQMKAVDPGIKVGAVVVTGEDSYANYTDHPAVNPRTGQAHNGWTPVMLATMASLGVTPDYVVFHRYPEAPGAESDWGLLTSSASWAADAADLRQQLNDYLGGAAPGVELVCTENNSVYTTPGKQTTSLVNGLFLADSLATAMQTEFNGVVWWDFRNAQETGNNNSSSLYGWRSYGDYGIVSAVVPAGPADRYPTFYVAKLLQHFGRAGDLVVEAGSDYAGLAAYAARRQDGTVTLLVINKTATMSLPASISVAGHTFNGSMAAHSYGIPQDEAARTGVGSADIAVDGYTGVGPSFAYTFPPYSATVLVLNGSAPPPPPVVRRPDGLIRNSTETAWLGDNVYAADGAGQVKSQAVRTGKSATFHLQVQNDGSDVDSFLLRGPGNSAGFTVRYYTGTSGGTEITSAVTSGGHAVANLAVGGSQSFRMVVTVARSVATGTIRESLVTATSSSVGAETDGVKAVVSVR